MTEMSKEAARVAISMMTRTLEQVDAERKSQLMHEAALLITAYQRAMDSMSDQLKKCEAEVAHQKRELEEQAKYIEELQHRPERKNKRPLIG
jgi:predicted RNase H-like nuclease (RuvC/YqgF family)